VGTEGRGAARHEGMDNRPGLVDASVTKPMRLAPHVATLTATLNTNRSVSAASCTGRPGRARCRRGCTPSWPHYSDSGQSSGAKRCQEEQLAGPNGICHLVGQFLRFPLRGTAFRTKGPSWPFVHDDVSKATSKARSKPVFHVRHALS
jgi:hypothetical protein